jgi:hypothetical protein
LFKGETILGDLKPLGNNNPKIKSKHDKIDYNKLIESSSNEIILGNEEDEYYKKEDIIKRNEELLKQEEIMLNKQRD